MNQAQPSRSRARPRWSHCNLLRWQLNQRHLWQFTVAGKEVAPHSSESFPEGTPLPLKAISRGWNHLWARKLNLAWFPLNYLFLRVVHLPKCAPEELPPMLELQLEKLSPLPVGQVVWSYQVIEQLEDDLQTVVLILAARNHVEQLLGALEQDGFLTDQLRIPFLGEMIQPASERTGAWVYLLPETDNVVAVAGWWRAGRLSELSLIRLAHGESGPEQLAQQLARLAWAGEIEAWFDGTTQWHLVGDETVMDPWKAVLENHLGCSMTCHPLMSLDEAAKTDAQDAHLTTDPLNLLPAGFAARYRQRYVDQLWMRSLGALAVLYCVGVVAYFAFLQVFRYQLNEVKQETAALSGSYTNAIQLKERIELMQEQTGLQYAALDCLKTVSELLPPELTLTRFNFERGNKLFLSGTVSAQDQNKANTFNSNLKKARLESGDLFERENVSAPQFTGVNWKFEAPLRLEGSP